METTKLIKENEKDVVEVTIPQEAKVIKYPREELNAEIERFEAYIAEKQADLDVLKSYKAMLPKEVIKEEEVKL